MVFIFQLRDTELGAIVNRDLTRKVRVANGITAHKQVAQNDLRLVAKLVQIFDKRWGMYQPDSTENEEEPRKSKVDKKIK